MAPTRKPNDGLLARVNFPLYCVEMITSRHVLVAGGGGSSKTGVANGLEIYEIYHNGDKFVATEVIRHETGSSVVMNCAVKSSSKTCRRSFIMVGQESHCQLYHVNMKVVKDGNDTPSKQQTESEETLRHRKTNGKHSGIENIPVGSGDASSHAKRLKFDIKPGDSIQTDFLMPEPLQRIVRISPHGTLMATGGLDGHIRVWQFPQLVKLLDISGHTKEIDDLDFSPYNERLVSISKDGQGVIWDLKTGKEFIKLSWTPPEGIKYLFKRCRFGAIEDSANKCRLFTLSNPFGKSGKQKGFLQQFDPETGKLNKIVAIDESLAALAVRDDGRFVAVGTMFSGSVSIYIGFSLQRVLHIPNAHSMFVTGLEFLPRCNNDGPPISSDTEAAVLSISVDNRVCIHSLQYRHSLPAWFAIVIIIVMLFLTYLFCSYFGL